MKQVISYFIKYPVAGNVTIVLLIFFGYTSMTKMKSTFFPVVPAEFIKIQIVYPGASPEEIEEGIVLKIEDNLKGTTGIERVTSTSNENTASIDVEIKKGNDVDVILQDVKNAVDRISSFPTNMEPPVVYKLESLQSPYSLALTGTEDLRKLKQTARKLERDFLSADGISKVELSGFPEEEIAIELNLKQLNAHDLTVREVMDKISAYNLEISGGTLKGENEELLIRSRNKGYYASNLSNIVIQAFPDGRRLFLKDLAIVEDRWEDSPKRNFYNGEPSVTIDLKSTPDEDFLFITDFVKNYISEFNAENSELKLNTVRDGSINLEARIRLLIENGFIGFVLVLGLLSAFLNFRLALWVAVSIPISFAGMFILAQSLGYTINVVSLYGMIIVIGILVDDGIVISENIYRHHEMGKSRIQAAIDGSMEVLGAVLSAIITTIIAFLSFFYLEGRIGDFFQDMAFVVIATLLFSLIEGALILPGHVAHSKALSGNGIGKKKPNLFERLMNWMRNKLYAPVLKYCLDNKFITIAISMALLMLILGAIDGGFIKTTFFPFIERDNVTIGLKMPAGTRENTTREWIDHIEAKVWHVNEEIKNEREDRRDVIEAIDKKIGPGTHEAALKVTTIDIELRDMPVLALTQRIREEVGLIPEAEDIEYGVRSAFGKPVSISVMGDDLDQVRGFVEDLKLALSELESLRDIIDNDQEGRKEIDIKLKDKAYLLGLTTKQVMAQVREGFFGGEVQRLQRGQDEVKVWVRISDEDRTSLSNLDDLRIRTSNGASYRLSEIADYTIQRGVLGINHTDGQREIRVDADISNPDVSVTDLLANIESSVLPTIKAKYPFIRTQFEGQNRERMKTARSMQEVVIPILILMFAVVVITFRSFMQTLVVILIIPFGYIGVSIGHYIHDAQLSLFSILGIIALIGILINDSLVFISAYNVTVKEGKTMKEAVFETGMNRFRPIVLTSITTIAGLMPLLLDGSFQAQFLVPMAISVGYGLMISTVMILLLLPVLLLVFNQLMRFIHWWWYDEWLKPREVEPAVTEFQEQNED